MKTRIAFWNLIFAAALFWAMREIGVNRPNWVWYPMQLNFWSSGWGILDAYHLYAGLSLTLVFIAGFVKALTIRMTLKYVYVRSGYHFKIDITKALLWRLLKITALTIFAWGQMVDFLYHFALLQPRWWDWWPNGLLAQIIRLFI